jgi:hypothetical protein
MSAVFTVFFEDPFWVGLLESEDSSGLCVARVVFGAEPGNAELLDFMLNRFASMPRFSPQAPAPRSRGETVIAIEPRQLNPKRAARAASKAMRSSPSTKAQAALSAARDAAKGEREASSCEDRRAASARRFELRAEKRKLKRSGH